MKIFFFIIFSVFILPCFSQSRYNSCFEHFKGEDTLTQQEYDSLLILEGELLSIYFSDSLSPRRAAIMDSLSKFTNTDINIPECLDQFLYLDKTGIDTSEILIVNFRDSPNYIEFERKHGFDGHINPYLVAFTRINDSTFLDFNVVYFFAEIECKVATFPVQNRGKNYSSHFKWFCQRDDLISVTIYNVYFSDDLGNLYVLKRRVKLY